MKEENEYLKLQDVSGEDNCYELIATYFSLEHLLIFRKIELNEWQRSKFEDFEPRLIKNIEQLSGIKIQDLLLSWNPVAINFNNLSYNSFQDEVMSALYKINQPLFDLFNLKKSHHKPHKYMMTAQIIRQVSECSYYFSGTLFTPAKFQHEIFLQLLPKLLNYKIENESKFSNFEKVFEYLSDDNKLQALFFLDILR